MLRKVTIKRSRNAYSSGDRDTEHFTTEEPANGDGMLRVKDVKGVTHFYVLANVYSFSVEGV